jgi:hypothetical protein
MDMSAQVNTHPIGDIREIETELEHTDRRMSRSEDVSLELLRRRLVALLANSNKCAALSQHPVRFGGILDNFNVHFFPFSEYQIKFSQTNEVAEKIAHINVHTTGISNQQVKLTTPLSSAKMGYKSIKRPSKPTRHTRQTPVTTISLANNQNNSG